MPVIARDAVASGHLVYAWPFPIGPDPYEVSCSNDELVVMCPAWMVGDRLGPGRHRWRTPDPTRPTAAFFVLTSPVEVLVDCSTQFVIPTTGQPVRLRGTGSLQVRCSDPALLIAQFVGLPFDHVNDGILRSVSRSVERMLARLLTRRVVMAGTPAAVTEPAMLANIIEELVAYNPAAGAVFGVELTRIGHLEIYADDGSTQWHDSNQHLVGRNGETPRLPMHAPLSAAVPLLETVRLPRPESNPAVSKRAQSVEASGEIVIRPATPPPVAKGSQPVARKASTVEVPRTDETTETDARTPPPGSKKVLASESSPDESRGSILGIGVSHIGSREVASGEIPMKIPPGSRVLVPGPDGLMQSATVRQLLQGYYELEVGGSGETIWVPMNGVVPE
jgi:hypothetical protein